MSLGLPHCRPSEQDLGADFLVDRCWRSIKLAVALHWSLIVDCDGPAARSRVGKMQSHLYATLQEHNPAAHEAVNGQVRFKAFLDQFSKEVRSALGELHPAVGIHAVQAITALLACSIPSCTTSKVLVVQTLHCITQFCTVLVNICLLSKSALLRLPFCMHSACCAQKSGQAIDMLHLCRWLRPQTLQRPRRICSMRS